MNHELTFISQHNMNHIKEYDMTPGEIISFLENGAIYRTFSDVLKKVCPDEERKKILIERLSEITGTQKDSIAKNIRNWTNKNESNQPQREQLFQICFALQLDEYSGSRLLSSASETGIHYRNPEELIYAYCLRNRNSWKEAQRLKEKLLPLCICQTNKKVKDQETKGYTRHIQKEFEEQVTTEEDLEQFFRRNAERLGKFHETGYEAFRHMLKKLQDPDAEFDDSEYDYVRKHKKQIEDSELESEAHLLDHLRIHDEGLKKQTVEALVKERIQMHVPENTSRTKQDDPLRRDSKKTGVPKKRNFTYLQWVVQKNWPSESIICKMKNHEFDVTRKVLLLLFLLTEEFEVDRVIKVPEIDDEALENENYLDQLSEKGDAGERMEARLMQINLFLDSYGMNQLDPGNAFDCLVLYALRASYEDDKDVMSSRLEETLKILFEPNPGYRIIREGKGVNGNGRYS